jgi:phosphate transport system permease protein
MNSSATTIDNFTPPPKRTIDRVRQGLAKRKAAEKRFKAYGLIAIILGLLFLTILFTSITSKGYSAFQITYVKLEVFLDPAELDPSNTGDPEVLSGANYGGLVKSTLRTMFPEATGRRDKRALYSLVSSGADYQLRHLVMNDPSLIGTTVTLWAPADDDIDTFMKGHIDRDAPESDRRLKDNQIAWVDQLVAEQRIEKRFNTTFFTAGDSRDPELAGIWGAAVGSFFTLLVTLALSFPIAVAAAV